MNNSDMPAMPNTMDPQAMKELHPDWDSKVSTLVAYNIGITKREHFAAMAMQGICGTYDPDRMDDSDARICAKYAIGHADALLAALEATNEH